MAASVQTDTGFTSGTPEMLFDVPSPYVFEGPGRNYDVAPDGRFLMIQSAASDVGEAAPEITAALNWLEELLERVPVP